MKIIILILVILSCAVFISAQSISSAVEIATVYSENGEFYLKSVPFDNHEPSLRGKASVYKTGSETPIYEFERGFDSVRNNNLILSNNGEVIFYVIGWGAEEKKEGLKSITIYKKGQITKSFTESEITRCDESKERCSLLYNNFEKVIDREKSNWGTRNYKRTFKDGVSEQEKFLYEFPLFSSGDTIYLTDSKKQVHIFDLKEGILVRSEPFENIYEQIKNKGRKSEAKIKMYNAPHFGDFPKLKGGLGAAEKLATFLEMKTAEGYGTKDEQFKLYRVTVSGMISRDGSFEIEEIDLDEGLPKEKISEFFRTSKFDMSSVPLDFEKWYIDNEYFYFRNKSDQIARKERQQEIIKQKEELKKRLVAEKIGDVYIPKDLGECFVELDKLLKEVDKKEMQALKSRDEMIQYHHGLGMWIRNNWGLWSGSRLQKYFTDKGVTHPDEMSSVILFYYYDWLNSKKESWKEWEKNPKTMFEK